MRLFPFLSLSILAIYGAAAFTVIYFAVRLAIRHERGTGRLDPGMKSAKSFWVTILAVMASVTAWNLWGAGR